MKKILIASIVGGILIFICQSLSWTVLNMHEPAQQYTPKQEAILEFLGSQLDEGGYLVPNVNPDATSAEMQQAMDSMKGSPWATISYHKTMNSDMYGNMGKNLLTDIVTVLLLCIIISGFATYRFANIFIASLFTGLIVFMNAHYTTHIWYELFDISAHFVDALVSWSLCGIWLGWYFSKQGVIERRTE